MSKCFLGLFILLLVTRLGLAQSAQPSFFHYTTKDGLPSSECYEIIQDQKGYIWISTDNGVSRFDGHQFKNYGIEEKLLDKTVLIMKEDHRGWIWMSTFSGNFYILRGDTIVPYAYNHLIQELRNEFYAVKNFAIDTLGNLHANLSPYNIIKITTDGQLTIPSASSKNHRGIYLGSGTPMSYTPSSKNLERDPKLTLLNVFDEHGLLKTIPYPRWSIHEEEKNLFREAPLAVFPLENINVFQILDRLFFWDYDQLLDYSHYPNGPINQFVRVNSGALYLSNSTLKGVYVYPNLAALKRNQPEYHFLNNFTVSHIFQDRHGGIWYATIENGIFYSPTPEVQTLLTIEINRYENFIRHVSVINDSIAIAFNHQQEYLQISNTGHQSLWQLFPFNSQLRRSHYHKNSGLLLVGPVLFTTPTTNINWQPTYMRDRPHTKVSFKSLGDSRKFPSDIWFSSYSAGLAVIGRLRAKNQRLEEIEQFTFLDRARIHTIAEVDNLLALGDRKKVYFFDPTSKEITEVPAFDTLNSRIDDLYYTRTKKLLIATRGQGLGVFDPATNKLQLISTNDLLVSNSIHHVVEDRYNHIWVSSQNGINKLILDDSITIQSYTVADGLPSDDVIDLDEWGDFMAATTTQGIALLPLAAQHTTETVTPLLYDVYLNNEPFDFIQNTVFSYQENSLRFVFHYLNYRYQGKFNYRYRLHPEDGWTTTDNREIILSSLPPDSYDLEVEISALGLSSSQRIQFPFTIKPPFWQRTWVLVTSSLIVLLVIFSLINNYINRLRQENERSKLDEDINKLRQQAYRAQMNPHFIFNCLSTIQGMIIGDTTEQDAAVRMIARFSQLIRLALDASNEETVTLEEELKLLNNYLGLEQIRFNQRFAYEIKVDPKLERDWIQIPPMLVQPFVENAVLHGMEHKNGDGKIIVEYAMEQDHLRIKISDNGPGISVTKAMKAKQSSKYQHKSLGMTITQKRLAILNHADYEFFVKEPRDENGKILGTEITLQIPLQ